MSGLPSSGAKCGDLLCSNAIGYWHPCRYRR